MQCLSADNNNYSTMGSISKNLFGIHDGKDIYQYTIKNSKGNYISLISYGGIITSWLVNGKNIVAGFNNLADYKNNRAYMGCIIGRYANRIAWGKFSIDKKEYILNCNNEVNHLHGGYRGFDKVNWDVTINEIEGATITLQYLSKDGEEGYPGNLHVTVSYTYTNDDELIIEYSALADRATPVNLTSHCYFNLSGDISKTILTHSLLINAALYIPVNEFQIPSGERRATEGTAFDFSEYKIIGESMEKVNGGYDHSFVLNKSANDLSLAAILVAPDKEMQLTVYTTEPGLQLYTGNILDGSLINRDGKAINKHNALCLETQHFPDSPNQLYFPSTILLPGEKYYSRTIYKMTDD
jgi:aldose 1-epimerase